MFDWDVGVFGYVKCVKFVVFSKFGGCGWGDVVVVGE